MNQTDQNINKDIMDNSDDAGLIDLKNITFSDDQTWLVTVPNDSGQKVDIVDWILSCDWLDKDDVEYQKAEKEFNACIDEIFRNGVSIPDKHKFDSRTYVRPKKQLQRPSIHNMVDVVNAGSNLATIPQNTATTAANKYLTYNKYNTPSPMLRLKTFNVDANTDNSHVVKEYAMKRRSLVQDDDPQLEDQDITLVADASENMSAAPSKPISIDLSQPAHNVYDTFNKGFNVLVDRNSLGMYKSGESLMRMSPPSLVSSLLMENSGNFNMDSLEGRVSLSDRQSGLQPPGRESLDPMMTSMSLSILDEKDMNTSFFSQTTCPGNDSLIDSLPPSLVSSVNTSYIIPNAKPRSETQQETNIFSSATFTHLEQSEKLLSARPRCQLYNSFTKRESDIKNSESYTKSREEGCQIETTKRDSAVQKASPDMAETITLHYSNNKFERDNDAEKENFQKDDAFYHDMGLLKTAASERYSQNLTMNKQELNEIKQARQKLSLARKALPSEDKTVLPNQVDLSPVKTVQLPNQTITVPRHSMENASELLARRRGLNSNGFNGQEEAIREPPKRNATFKKSPKVSMDTTVVFMKEDDRNNIDINSATMNLITNEEKWGSQDRAMVGSSESTDTGTLSSSSPPESVPDRRGHVASTPLTALCKGYKNDLDLQNIHTTISPIYDVADDRRASEVSNITAINSATMIKKTAAKRDILASKPSEEECGTRLSPTNAGSCGSMVLPKTVPRRTGLPTSKLRQYSSHRELNRIPGSASNPSSINPCGRGAMTRRGVYASNPALSPTASGPQKITTPQVSELKNPKPMVPPPLVRQGTETLRRERPHSQIIAPKDLRTGPGVMAPPTSLPTPMRPNYMPPPMTRPYSSGAASQLRVPKPAVAQVQKPVPATSAPPAKARPPPEPRASALPRPSRLPAPRRSIRPPSVYSVAPTSDYDHY